MRCQRVPSSSNALFSFLSTVKEGVINTWRQVQEVAIRLFQQIRRRIHSFFKIAPRISAAHFQPAIPVGNVAKQVLKDLRMFDDPNVRVNAQIEHYAFSFSEDVPPQTDLFDLAQRENRPRPSQREKNTITNYRGHHIEDLQNQPSQVALQSLEEYFRHSDIGASSQLVPNSIHLAGKIEVAICQEEREIAHYSYKWNTIAE